MSARRLLRPLAAVGLAAAAVLAATTTASAAGDVDDFSYASWDAEYTIGVDAEDRARMTVTETLVAEFPEVDQNRGIVRGLPMRYEGASLDTRIVSVADETGATVPFETDEDDDVLYVLTGTDDYVHGATTYVITYEMRDVILAADTGVDEFYWDLLPLDSTQPIDDFSARIVFEPALSERLTGAAACYFGVEGSSDRCDIAVDTGIATVSESALSAGEGVTVAIALEPGAVVQPGPRLPDATTDIVPLALGGAALALTAGGWISASALVRSRRRGTGIIVAQYDVPATMPPIVAQAVVPGSRSPIAAQIVHLAVQGMVRFEELPDESGAGRPRLRRLAAPIPDPLDQRALKALFDSDASDAVVTVPAASEAFAKRMQKLQKAGTKAAVTRGLTTTARSRAAVALTSAALGVVAVGLGLGIWGAVQARETAVPGILACAFVLIGTIVSLVSARAGRVVLTAEGARELEHLEGVREFIRVAEADRLQMLQSYSGAERRSDGTVDVIHVYERLLPYAILFGQEREWGAVLESAYAAQRTSPVWIDGVTTGLVIRMGLFSSATASAASYSSPSSGSSSSFGGSGGGGFSGGGGGGGFSGGR